MNLSLHRVKVCFFTFFSNKINRVYTKTLLFFDTAVIRVYL